MKPSLCASAVSRRAVITAASVTPAGRAHSAPRGRAATVIHVAPMCWNVRQMERTTPALASLGGWGTRPARSLSRARTIRKKTAPPPSLFWRAVTCNAMITSSDVCGLQVKCSPPALIVTARVASVGVALRAVMGSSARLTATATAAAAKASGAAIRTAIRPPARHTTTAVRPAAVFQPPFPHLVVGGQL
jgi:hypothetical protein